MRVDLVAKPPRFAVGISAEPRHMKRLAGLL